MKTYAALICSVVSVLFAVLFELWVKKHEGTGEDNASVLAAIRGRNRNFISFHYLSIIAAVVLVSAGAGFGMSWKQAAACAAGALTVILPVFIGSLSFPEGVTAAYNEVSQGDLRQSVRAGYRTGAVMGSCITGVCLAVLVVLSLMMKSAALIGYAASFGLGSAVSAMIVHTGGEVYSSAYSLAVPAKDFTDRTGTYLSAASDYAGSYIVAAASAIMLADVAVATSGVTSTLTVGDAVRFPLFVYGAGIVGSIIGFLVTRAGIGNDLSRGSGIGCIAAGIITAAASFYFSINMMQTRVYAWAVTTGLVAAVILALLSRMFSYDSKIFLSGYKLDKSFGKHASVIFNFGRGMISSAVYTIIIVAAVIVSYMFASYYGIALCAVGMCSIIGSVFGVTGLAAVSSSASDILVVRHKSDDSEQISTVSGILDAVSSKNLIFTKTYATITGAMTSFAAFSAYFYVAGAESIDIMTLRVFVGIIIGVSASFLITGTLIGSVRITGRVALRDIGRNDDDTGATSSVRGAVIPAVIAIAFPIVIGLLAGAKALAGFVIASVVTGYLLITATNNSGMYYENTAIQSISSLLKAMAIFSVAFLPVFMKIGGFLFQ